MNMRFLGTGAAELYPNPYCDCEVCERARRAKEIRLRSAFLLNEHNMVDFGVDVLAASALYDIPLYAIENVFITHTHPDHFCLDNIGAATMAGKRSGHWPIRFYLSAPAKAWLEQYLAAVRPLYGGASEVDALLQMGRVEFCAVEPYRWFEAGGLRVFALETNHIVNGKEPALNYLFEMPDGTRLLYACDTGLYGEKALGALAGARVGIVVTEGTFGSKTLPRESAHLCGQNCCEQLRALAQAGALAEGARAYITHINQENEWNTAQYQAYMDKNAPIPVTIARDGMKIG